MIVAGICSIVLLILFMALYAIAEWHSVFDDQQGLESEDD